MSRPTTRTATQRVAPFVRALLITVVALPLHGACTGGTGSEDAGVEEDPFASYGEPITADAHEWSWVPFDDAHCGNGATAGIGINPSSDSTRVLLYLEGGGLCWDDFTCNQQETALFVKRGFNSADMDTFVSELGGSGLFDRDDPSNPFRDFSFVYVPYCTGDLHAGSRAETEYGVMHVGYENVGAYLHRVVPSFKDATDVVLAGTSAGGFGAMLNYDRVQRAFMDVPVSLLIDSAPPFPESLIPPEMQAVQREAWNLEPAIPEGCGDGCGDLHGAFRYLLEAYPTTRVGLISSLQDQTLRYLVGLGSGQSVSAQHYQAAVSELVSTTFLDDERARVYLVPGGGHVFLYSPLGGIVVDGVSLASWIGGLVDGEAGWRNVIP